MPPRRTDFEEALEQLARRIESGEWPVDSRIPNQEQLADELGFGRTVIHQAIRTLSTNGMLESARGRGTFVRARNAVDPVLGHHLYEQPVTQTLELRRSLEVEAAGLAAARRDDKHLAILRAALVTPQRQCWTSTYQPATGRTQVSPDAFHTTVFAASRNPLLARLHQCTVAALWHARLESEPADLRGAGHLRIFESIERGDVQAARTTAAAHADRDMPSRED